MAKKAITKKAPDRSGKLTAIGLAAAGAVVAGVALASARKAKAGGSTPEAPSVDEPTLDPLDDVDLAPTTRPVGEPLRYTGSGTPDMAINYTPGADGSADRVAGDDSQALGNAEEREALAGVRN